ncbi:MAG: type II toxin-antitoxin system VapC family toxin, partial [Desulfobulbaceae bacterium]|nr:type II toxin-antitoxin system VapC family toxin [Desulfobulbaceae bacterium]
ENALQTIIESLSSGQLGVATLSFWEVAVLVEKQRLTMQTDLDVWRSDLLQTGLLEVSLPGTTAVLAGQPQLFHGGPADRLIVVSAIENGSSLITADTKILSWKALHPKIDAQL